MNNRQSGSSNYWANNTQNEWQRISIQWAETNAQTKKSDQKRGTKWKDEQKKDSFIAIYKETQETIRNQYIKEMINEKF